MESLLRKSLGEGGYQDIRFEDLVLNTIVFKGNKLEDIAVSRERGGHARAVSGGGWGAFSFSDPEQSRVAVEKALQASSLIPGNKEIQSTEATYYELNRTRYFFECGPIRRRNRHYISR